MDCIFCAIAQKKQDADIVHEDEQFVVFHDTNPKAPLHLLIVPKQHISSVKDMEEEHRELMGNMIFQAKRIGAERNLAGYKLQINVGREGGQAVDHIHLHLLAWPGEGGAAESPVV